MSDEEKKPEEKKKLISWKSHFSQILTAVVSVIVLGIVGFAGTYIKRAIDKVEENSTEIILFKEDMKHTADKLEDIATDLEETSDDYKASFGSIDGRLKALEIKQLLMERDIEDLEE